MVMHLDTPVQFLKGVGPRIGDLLRKRGIITVGDLLHWYPRAYEDRRAARNISSLRPGEMVSLKANVVGVRSYNLGRSKRKMYDVIVGDESGTINCKYFRVPYRGYFERFQPNQTVRVVGKVTQYRSQIQFQHPDIRDVEAEEEESDALIPLYTETEGLSPNKIQQLMKRAIYELIDSGPVEIPDYYKEQPAPMEKLPKWILENYHLVGLEKALKCLHMPPENSGTEFSEFSSPYHERVIFDEFFWLELYLATKKVGFKKEDGPAISAEGKLAEKIQGALPFQLTNAQKKSLHEILNDLKEPHPMHRMVQGDVGSGKTLVALIAASFVIEAGFQSALMVPTEILAEQHYKNAVKLFEPLGIQVGLLTGSMKVGEKREVVNKLQSGEIQLCIGTHALIQEGVDFQKLGLAIIDEQHRFGVFQRAGLKQKGHSPHFLLMTATPIPRTLAMTVYGDLDVSIIDELPPGRSPIVTRVTYENKRPKVYQFLKDQLAKGRQAYIVYPLVEESEKMDLKDAMSSYESLKEQFPDITFGLLHGKMKPAEKEEVMRDFRDLKYQVLVSTTVIEVGVDVPNSNLMIIEHTERFGLSQLHQLRGRVGRGQHKSYCVLMLGRAVSDESRERAQIMERTTDGFKIAEADLELRGPGEFLGTRQSGLPGFKLANLVRDIEILQKARQAAFEVVRKDPRLERKEHDWLRYELVRHHGPGALAGIG